MLLQLSLKLCCVLVIGHGDPRDIAVDRDAAVCFALPYSGCDTVQANYFFRAMNYDCHDVFLLLCLR